MNAITAVKFIGAWFCVIAAVAFLIMGGAVQILPQVLAILAIAFALAPSTW